MAKSRTLLIIVLVLFLLLASTAVSPILIVAEDTTEGDPGIDMAATLGITGFNWIYPGSSFNEQGQTLHNVHLNNPEDPYGAARDIMSYTYHVTPHIIVSVNNDAAEAIFSANIIDNIRANDAYNGYGNPYAQGTMSRGGAVSTAMGNSEMNLLEVPLQVLLGNISFHLA